MLTQPGYQASCFASVLAFAFTIYNTFRPDPCSRTIDTPQVQPDYDFIIVGGGSAGTVVANRLSEIADWKVLLLEAGGHETDYTDVPYLQSQLIDSEFDWKYRTEPPRDGQRYCLAMTDHSCKWPRGKVVGGSSVINTFQYVRGNKRDYDNWEAAGNEGWGYSHVLKYFLKSENNSNPSLLKTPYHSCGGYLTVEDARYTSPLAPVFVEGGEHLGYKHVDVNGENQTGFTILQGTIRNGRRCSTSKAFIRPAQRRSNLNILMYSLVTKIGFEYENHTARARVVYFIKGETEYSVRAKKEIILSAGAINSPQILMLSGVGPEDHLADHGIKVVKNLRVGSNLQDHVTTGALIFEVDKPVTFNSSTAETPDAVSHYIEDGKGPLTILANIDGIAFVNSKYANQSGSNPDIQFVFQSTTIFNSNNKSFGNAQYGLRPNLFYGTGYEHVSHKYLFTVHPFLLHPLSRGRVMLKSRDPFDYPSIIPNYFAKKRDMDVLIDAVKLVLELVRTPPFKVFNATPLKIPFPDCEGIKLFSDEYCECIIRQFTYTFYHQSCTCAMGVGSDAVVDPQLKVHGVDGLRVIDASVMPIITSGNTNAPTIMIAEKGSDMIKEYWGVHSGPQFVKNHKQDCSKIRMEC